MIRSNNNVRRQKKGLSEKKPPELRKKGKEGSLGGRLQISIIPWNLQQRKKEPWTTIDYDTSQHVLTQLFLYNMTIFLFHPLQFKSSML